MASYRYELSLQARLLSTMFVAGRAATSVSLTDPYAKGDMTRMTHKQAWVWSVALAITLLASQAIAQETTGGASDLTRLAIAKANEGSLQQSLDLFDRSIKHSNRDVTALFNRGKVLLIQRKADRAVRDLTGAIKLDPSLAEAYLARGMAYRLQGDYSKAVKDFDKAISLEPGGTAPLVNRAALFFDTGEHENALRDLDRLIQLNPRMVTALGNRAYILEQLGRYDDAIKDLGAILAQDTENLLAMKHLGFIYRQKGEFASALRWYGMALKLEQDKERRQLLQDEIIYVQRRASAN
jgi:tetratricopeptide (TPR) repeat protein